MSVQLSCPNYKQNDYIGDANICKHISFAVKNNKDDVDFRSKRDMFAVSYERMTLFTCFLDVCYFSFKVWISN